MSGERLLREYIRAVLSEDDSGGVYSDLASFDATTNPYGMSYGDGKELCHIFLEPLTDIFKTAAGKGKELSQRSQTLLKVTFEALATTLVPFLQDSYSEIFEREKEQLGKIRTEYAAVYRANWDALQDNDVLLAAFLYSPSSFITQRLAKQSPKVVINLLSILTGGSLDPWLEKVKRAFGFDDDEDAEKPAKKASHGGAPMNAFEGLMREEADGQPTLEQVLASDKVKAKLQDSDVVRKMEQRGQQLVRGTLTKVYKQAEAVMKANNLQALQKVTGKPIKGLDKLHQVPQQERGRMEQQLLAATRKGMISFYVKQLGGQVKQAREAGVPDEHPFITAYHTVISKVKAL